MAGRGKWAGGGAERRALEQALGYAQARLALQSPEEAAADQQAARRATEPKEVAQARRELLKCPAARKHRFAHYQVPAAKHSMFPAPIPPTSRHKLPARNF